MSDDLAFLMKRIKDLGDEVAELKRDRVTVRSAEVTAIDPVTSTFTALTLDGDELEGIGSPVQYLPAVGEVVRIRLHGATPIYEPERLNSASGTLAFNDLAVVNENPRFGGVPLNERLDPLASSVAYWGQATTTGPTVGSTETGYYELQVTLRKGRRYIFATSSWRVDASASGQQFIVALRSTEADGETVPATPTVSSTMRGRSYVDIVASNGTGQCPPIQGPLNTPAGDGYITYRFLVTLARSVGSGTAFLRSNNTGDLGAMWFTDAGPQTDQAFTANTGGGGTVTPAPKEYITTVNATWGASWRQNGTKFTNDGNRYQGVWDQHGNRYSAVGFPSVTAALAGATITRVRVYLNALSWKNGSGTAVIGIHGHTSEPANVSSGSLFGIKQEPFTGSGVEWVDLPSAYFDGWKTGSYRGLIFGPAPSTSAAYAGYFQSSATRIQIFYVK